MEIPTPTTVNPIASAVNSGIAAAVKAGETQVEALILADAPWAGLPVIKQLLEALIGYIGGKFSEVLQGVGTFTVIDVQVGHEKSAISQALADLVAAEKSGDQNAIQLAIQAYANAQSALVGDDGSAPPV